MKNKLNLRDTKSIALQNSFSWAFTVTDILKQNGNSKLKGGEKG